jgi:hypothetical protein
MKGSEDVSLELCAVDALDMEPRVASIGWLESRGLGEVAVAEDADMVLPKASVVVKSHCLVSAVLGRIGGVLAFPPE